MPSRVGQDQRKPSGKMNIGIVWTCLYTIITYLYTSLMIIIDQAEAQKLMAWEGEQVPLLLPPVDALSKHIFTYKNAKINI